MKQSIVRRICKKPFSLERICQLFGPQATLEEVRQAASRICRDYLTGRWKVVTAEQLIVKRISGGLSNFLYYVSLPHDDISLEGGATSALNVNPCDTAGSESAVRKVVALEAAKAFTAVDDENRNEREVSADLQAAADCNDNNNKRKRFNSEGERSASSLGSTQHEPQEVLLRIYGQSHGEDALEAMITESVVFALLSERNFGPKLHGIFPGGRIEQYIPARPLQTLELADSKISMKIAEKMGEIHSLNIPMSKEPDWLWNCMERWMRNLPAILSRKDWKENEVHAELVRGFNFSAEAKWLKTVIESGNYPVLFCHNDLQEGNILLRKPTVPSLRSAGDSLSSLRSNLEDSVLENISEPLVEDLETLKRKTCRHADCNNSTGSADLECSLDSVTSSLDGIVPLAEQHDLIIIDFEYCAYNYRGFDLANHFLEWTFDYSSSEFPYYYHRKQQYPTEQQRQLFIATYLRKLNEAVAHYEPSPKEVEMVEHEVRIFSMFSHLFWSLWSMVNVTSSIEFGYWDYAVTRIEEYKNLKHAYLRGNLVDVRSK